MTLLKFKRKQPEWGYQMEKFLKLETLLSWTNDECDKLIILEDPTPNMIAEIGGKFKIDPQFWADFLVGPSWFGSGKLYVGAGEPRIPYRDDSLLEQLWPLPSACRELEHASFRFIAHRERKLYTDSKRARKEMSPLFETYPIAQKARPGPPGCSQSVRLRGNLTIWRNWKARQRAEDEHQQVYEPWIGVTAIQRQSSRVPVSAQGYSYIFRNFLHRPRPEDKIDISILRLTEKWEGRSQREPKYNHSISDIYCYALKMDLKKKGGLERVAKSPNVLFNNLLGLMGCFWVTELESRHLQLSWMETFYYKQVIRRRQRLSLLNALTPNPLDSFAAKAQADLIGLHGVQIETGSYRYLVDETLTNCEALDDDGQFTCLIDDLKYLRGAISLLERRLKRDQEFLRSISDDFEKERSDNRNKLLLILALWAWLVSPVTLTSSIMNLGQDKSGSKKVGDVKIFWKVALILGIVVILFVVLILWATEACNWIARRRSSLKNSCSN
ncbi:hypothetical protein KXX16_004730 [Aspergillus fumigatus]|uniref:Uncharacterized protein n=1 Tax=Aspergillus fumigatus TaxID=746128 RepID=A0A8H4IAE6_ASPFM|nr:hypothetical protein CNMCM8689_000581 [Aspergillus fumigatus]KAF4292129.1 hypothetical protein CNMCM8686_007876 [Aspergillus fumigatus]KAH1277027.1 hypothetical protein KXX30_004453 [Aspergillus fumigatus]KAH1342697.1 hypothetical protein KXX33_004145 [Aspergillus fumigatus]KAH1350519.1 hypothetical protein KXX63_003900 [Aspergillus fumigatus]